MSSGASRVVSFPTGVRLASATEMNALGVYNMEMLRAEAKDPPPSLVEGLLAAGSLNLVVGNSGLGKTALLVHLGLSVAAGVTWLNREVTKGRVLYCDAESGQQQFLGMVDSLTRHMGLAAPPEEFFAHSPHWGHPGLQAGQPFRVMVRDLRPKLVIIDPLRVFFPKAEAKAEDAVAMVKFLRELSTDYGCAWILLHHRRKANKNGQAEAASLMDDPHGWLQEAAGAHALVNQTDTRLGIDVHKEADLVVAGMVRGRGKSTPMLINRVFDDDGEPLGYEPMAGAKLLDAEERAVYDKLPESFRYRDVVVAGGKSKKTRILEKLQTLNLIKKHQKNYSKLHTAQDA